LVLKSLAIIGGDLRQLAVANELCGKNFSIKMFAVNYSDFLSKEVARCANLAECVTGVDAVILPLPSSTDDKTINSATHKITLAELFSHNIPLCIGGKLSKYFHETAACPCFDYLDYEELSVKNAVPTAEGAIEIAFKELPVTLHGSECLVLGFGRIGKVLSSMLHGIGARVSCGARRPEDIAYINAYGYNAVNTANLNLTRQYDVIFNTIPYKILKENILKTIDADTLIIDLASKPGGADFILEVTCTNYTEFIPVICIKVVTIFLKISLDNIFYSC